MHFPAHRAAMRPGGEVGRQQLGAGTDFVEIFGNGQRIPYQYVAMVEAGYQDGGRQQQDLCPCRRVVRRHDVFLEREPGEPGHEPAAQGPRGVVLAGDAQSRLRHVSPLSVLCRLTLGTLPRERRCLVHHLRRPPRLRSGRTRPTGAVRVSLLARLVPARGNGRGRTAGISARPPILLQNSQKLCAGGLAAHQWHDNCIAAMASGHQKETTEGGAS